MGGSSSSSASSVNNADKRNAVQGGAGVSGDGNSVMVSSISNDTEVVRAIAQLGTDAIKQAGGAIVKLNENNAKLNADAWSNTLETGEKLVSKLADGLAGGFALANKSIDAFQPTDNKQAGVAMWVAIGGAVGLVALAVLNKGK